jgi:hypothetical protein
MGGFQMGIPVCLGDAMHTRESDEMGGCALDPALHLGNNVRNLDGVHTNAQHAEAGHASRGHECPGGVRHI